MGVADYLKWGDWNVICDRCGFKKKASMCSFDGYDPSLFVCKRCWKDKHPQDYIRGMTDEQNVPVSRPEQPDKFIHNGNI